MKAPNTKRIVWKMPDGSLRVTTPGAPMMPGETEGAYLDRIASITKAKVVPSLKDAVRMPDITPDEHAAWRRIRNTAKKKP